MIKISTAMTSIVLLTDGWGPKHGGINSFNTDLAKALGPLLAPETRVVCTVYEDASEERYDAQRHQVELLPIGRRGEKLDASKSSDVLEAFRARCGDPDGVWWIGHDLISGELATELAKQVGRSAVIHHMNYGTYLSFKHGIGAEAADRHRQQKAIFEKADRVFAVGPLLRDSLASMLRCEAHEVSMLVPGLADIRPSPTMPAIFSGITFGRLDPPNDRIKQGRLAVAAFADACRQACSNEALPEPLRRGPRMTLIGIARSGGEEEISIKELSEEYREGVLALVPLPYEHDRDRLFEELSGSSVAMMLSWHEGFGLTGWEAIAAEVPLIISKNSGLYQLIKDEFGGTVGCLKGIMIRGHYAADGEQNFRPEDVTNVAQAILEIAAQPENAKKSARTLLYLLRSLGRYTWDNSAQALAAALEISLPVRDPVPGAAGATTVRATSRSRSRAFDARSFPDYLRLVDEIAVRTIRRKAEPFVLSREIYKEMVDTLRLSALPRSPSTFVKHLHRFLKLGIKDDPDWAYFEESARWIAASVDDVPREGEEARSLRKEFEDRSHDDPGGVLRALAACDRHEPRSLRMQIDDVPPGWPCFLRNILLKVHAVASRSDVATRDHYYNRVGVLEQSCRGGAE